MKIKYSIGEISKIYNISTDTLRHYEKIGLIKPDRSKNSYRVYKLFDIWKLNVIKTMKNLGISLKEIKIFLENRSVDGQIDLLNRENKYIEKQIKELSYKKNNIESRLKILNHAKNYQDIYKVKIENIKERKVSFVESDFTKDDHVDFAYSQLTSGEDKKIYFLNRDFGMILPIENIKDGYYNAYTKAFLIHDENSKIYDFILDKGNYASIYFRGDYKNAKKVYEILFEYLKEKNLKTENFTIERYLIDINITDKIEEYLTKVEIKLK